MADRSHFYFQDYAEWKTALTQRCGIALTPEYARSRILALQDPNDATTREFAAKYGDDYLQQVVSWFEQAELEK